MPGGFAEPAELGLCRIRRAHLRGHRTWSFELSDECLGCVQQAGVKQRGSGEAKGALRILESLRYDS